jgi:predicted AAA+ superfamily ATPase
MMIRRLQYLARVETALARAPVVALLGPRQSGKTTLARQISRGKQADHFFDLENPVDRGRLENPMLALQDIRGLVVLDEIQRCPEIFPVLRVLVDRTGECGQFLILGSASPELLRQGSESLAGRIEFIELQGFSMIEAGVENQETLWERGGFPRSFLANTAEDSLVWRQQFIGTFLERDIPQLGVRVEAQTLARFWGMVAHRHGSVLNSSEIGRALGVSDHSIRKYVDLLEKTLVVRVLAPWSENLEKRQLKAPKIYIRDSGLFHVLVGIPTLERLRGHPALGASWEGFALEQTLVHYQGAKPFFWGTHAGAELDLFLEYRGQRLGFEFKYADVPKWGKSMAAAYHDLKLDRLTIIKPQGPSYRIKENVEVVALNEYCTRFADGLREGAEAR